MISQVISRRSNMGNMIKISSPKSQELIMSSQLKAVFDEKGASIKGDVTTFRTGGRSIAASLGKTTTTGKPRPRFSNESLNQLQVNIGIYNQKMSSIGNYLRVHCGWVSVIKLEKHMVERNRKLSENFETTKLTQKKKIKKWVKLKNGKERYH